MSFIVPPPKQISLSYNTNACPGVADFTGSLNLTLILFVSNISMLQGVGLYLYLIFPSHILVSLSTNILISVIMIVLLYKSFSSPNTI